MSSTPRNLSKSAQSVQDALFQKGLTFQVVELEESTRTALEAANAIGCDVSQIIKSLLFRTQDTKKPVLVLASGINRVNEKAIARHLGEKIEKADANFTKEMTGFVIGGIPPVGHQQVLTTFIDEDLIKLDTLWAAAGTPFAVFSLQAKDLQNLTAGTIISIK